MHNDAGPNITAHLLHPHTALLMLIGGVGVLQSSAFLQRSALLSSLLERHRNSALTHHINARPWAGLMWCAYQSLQVISVDRGHGIYQPVLPARMHCCTVDIVAV